MITIFLLITIFSITIEKKELERELLLGTNSYDSNNIRPYMTRT
ncbi:hypothetical protein ACHM2J_12355 [Clostridium perfringens]|nr:hypothetical protein [Clostridium perfringens]MDB2069881.1 hypothetical protein [Clostridium perfringens]MDM0926946.1 hypothetical protein [Clostridium perfringens]MDU1687751.1 hypothetical protein [Clostridium perfringens]MDU1811171.1 hypothetical protein [Clostridium perfringens]